MKTFTQETSVNGTRSTTWQYKIQMKSVKLPAEKSCHQVSWGVGWGENTQSFALTANIRQLCTEARYGKICTLDVEWCQFHWIQIWLRCDKNSASDTHFTSGPFFGHLVHGSDFWREPRKQFPILSAWKNCPKCMTKLYCKKKTWQQATSLSIDCDLISCILDLR